jgi:exopolyphosphatase/guanosine-5'-triphosphate,3'-diphosphate pyrophosphatase
MAKRTAVIDIGSNSARMVVFERTSRFGFHLLNETKSRVRISEGAYERQGELQEAAMARAEKALAEFTAVARHLKARKVLCVATSAVRDAPNRNRFLKRIKQTTGLQIKVIDGDTEARFGGIAAVNLLPVTDGVTIDIGGGSTDLALIHNRRVVATHSLKLGTVRLKELFFDKKRPIEEAGAYIDGALQTLPQEFRDTLAIAIGGTARAVTKAIMERNDHPIDRLHAYTYDWREERRFVDKIAHASVMKLGKLGIKKERLDTIRPGALILSRVVERLGAKRVMTSGAGVREGVFLSDLLRNQNHLFPAGFNPSVRSLHDRFCDDPKFSARLAATARSLFGALQEPCHLPESMLYEVETAARLSPIGIRLNYYGFHKHSAYFVLNQLEYGFTHQQMILIATLIRFNKRRLPKESFTKPYKRLLPHGTVLSWLSYIVSLAQAIHTNRANQPVTCHFKKGVLRIEAPFEIYLAAERIKTLEKPGPIAVQLTRC